MSAVVATIKTTQPSAISYAVDEAELTSHSATFNSSNVATKHPTNVETELKTDVSLDISTNYVTNRSAIILSFSSSFSSAI